LLPQSCKVEILKQNRIEKMDEDFTLVAHPFPAIEGEMLLFQQKSEDQEDVQTIVIRDYSLKKRMVT